MSSGLAIELDGIKGLSASIEAMPKEVQFASRRALLRSHRGPV